jgi:hypothetical protein
MPMYMDIHDGFVGVTKEQLEEAHRLDTDIQADEGVSYDEVWHDPTSGKVFCLVTGPSLDAVKRIHERAGHPTDQVFEIAHNLM